MRTNALAAAVAASLLAGCSGMMDHHQSASSAPKSTAASGGSQGVMLSGKNEVPPNTSGASGSGTVTVSADCAVTANITVTGMTATAAHIHTGAAGANGPVAIPFTKTGDNAFSAPAGAKMDAAQCAAYKKGETYVNVHSAAHPGGEVRAQLAGK